MTKDHRDPAWVWGLSDAAGLEGRYRLFFSLPFGRTVVTGGIGRSLNDSFGGEVSFFGFFVILLLRCSPLGMSGSSVLCAM